MAKIHLAFAPSTLVLSFSTSTTSIVNILHMDEAPHTTHFKKHKLSL